MTARSPVLRLQAQGLGLRQYRRVYDLEVNVAEEVKVGMSAFDVGVVSALGALAIALKASLDSITTR